MADRRQIGALALAGAAVGWVAVRRSDVRRVRQDPERDVLFTPFEGEPLAVQSADGTVLHAQVFGPEGAPTIVLLHGWTCQTRFWQYQLRELSRDFRVVAYDQRGHGRSGPAADGDYSMEAFAADFQAVLDACVPDGERVVAAGHSMGAMTLAAWAGEHPGDVQRRLSGVALMNTGMGDLISETLVVRMPTALGRVKQFVGRQILSARLPMPTVPTPLVFRGIRYVAMHKDASPARVAFCENMLLSCSPESRGACGNTMSRMDLHDSVASLKVPAIVIAGVDDRLTPLAHARRMAESLPDLVELVEIPRSGHMSPIEAPEIVNAKLRALAAAPVVPAAAAA
jgi:pimeloyl-ACP methyl ester carboxylesterase